MKIYKKITDLVGNTPLLELVNHEKNNDLKATLLAKLEYFNPAGSVKDRIAKEMIDDAEQKGVLKPGAVIIEPTSGNTGIGLAAVGLSRGYKIILTMPETMSIERRNLLSAYGAELVLTEGAKGMTGAIEKAKELQTQIPGSVILGQFDNPANARAHYETTGPELWRDTEGKIDIFVAGIGTGGTITGTGRFLKEQNPDIQVVGVEPASSPLLTGGTAASHGIQGIGANFIPALLDRELLDQVMDITDEQAIAGAHDFSHAEGILIGISSGAAVHAAIELASLPENEGKTIVALLPDGGDRYLSTGIYN